MFIVINFTSCLSRLGEPAYLSNVKMCDLNHILLSLFVNKSVWQDKGEILLVEGKEAIFDEITRR
jgi:hypothetical protein